jgi:hypothetical protein
MRVGRSPRIALSRSREREGTRARCGEGEGRFGPSSAAPMALTPALSRERERE